MRQTPFPGPKGVRSRHGGSSRPGACRSGRLGSTSGDGSWPKIDLKTSENLEDPPKTGEIPPKTVETRPESLVNLHGNPLEAATGRRAIHWAAGQHVAQQDAVGAEDQQAQDVLHPIGNAIDT